MPRTVPSYGRPTQRSFPRTRICLNSGYRSSSKSTSSSRGRRGEFALAVQKGAGPDEADEASARAFVQPQIERTRRLSDAMQVAQKEARAAAVRASMDEDDREIAQALRDVMNAPLGLIDLYTKSR